MLRGLCWEIPPHTTKKLNGTKEEPTEMLWFSASIQLFSFVCCYLFTLILIYIRSNCYSCCVPWREHTLQQQYISVQERPLVGDVAAADAQSPLPLCLSVLTTLCPLVRQTSPTSLSRSCHNYWLTQTPLIPWMEMQLLCTFIGQRSTSRKSKVRPRGNTFGVNPKNYFYFFFF